MAVLPLPTLINGVSYTHADVILIINNVPVIGCTAIDYGDTQDITPNFSTGQKPSSVGFGKVEFRCTITLTLEAVEAIQALSPDGRIQNIGFFNVDVSYLSTEGGVFVHHRLKSCKFKGRNPNSAVDNSQIEEALELFVGDIDY